MYNISKNLKNIYTILSSLMLSIGLSSFLFLFWGFEISLGTIIFWSILVTAILGFADYSQNKIVVLFALLIFAGFTVLFAYLFKNELLDFTSECFYWFKSYILERKEYNLPYAKFISIFFIIFISLIGYIINRYIISKVISSFALIIGGFASIFFKFEINNITAFGTIIYIFYTFLELYGILGKSNPKHKMIINKYLFPVCFVTAFLIAYLPASQEAIKWTFIKNIYYTITDSLELMAINVKNRLNNSNVEFKVSMAGYSEDTSLGGIIIKSSKPMMYVNVLDKPKHSIYLTGSVKNEYTGREWIFNDESEYSISENLLDSYEFMYSIYIQSLERLARERLLSTKKITIKYGKINTITCFAPLKTYNFELKKRDNLIINNGNILYDKMKNSKNEYVLRFLDYNVDGRILRSVDNFDYNLDLDFSLSELENFIRYYTGENLSISSKEEWIEIYSQRAANIEKNYLKLPSNLSQEVIELTYDITKDYESNYDKLKAIEKYLSNFTYTLFPSSTPNNRDFVEYFLLEQKEGYCTYFASAMTLMSRIIGMPSRYVQGVTVDYSAQNERYEYIVEDSAAHAWPEVYFEGVGWIAFEPTPGCYSSRYNSWETMVSDINYKEEVPRNFSDIDYEDEDEEQELDDYDLKFGTLDNEKEEEETQNYFIPIILGLLVTLILFPFIYYKFVQRRYLNKFKKANINEKIYLEFIEILYLFEQEGIKLEKNETLSKFSDRISEIYKIEGIKFELISNIYMKSRYSSYIADIEELKEIQIYKERLNSKIYEKISKIKIILKNFIFYVKINDYKEKY